jgi:hypothetical protein
MRFYLAFPRNEPDEAQTAPIPETTSPPERTQGSATSRVASV